MVRAEAAFLRLLRLPFAYGGVAGVALGAALAVHAGAPLDPLRYALVQVLVTSFQLMVHCANDHFDREGDRAGLRTAWSGGSGVLTAGALAPNAALAAALVFAAAGCAAAAALVAAGRPLAAGLGVAVGVLAWCYSAPPIRLAQRGWGEADAVAVVAILVPATAYAAFTGSLDVHRLLSALAPAAAAMFAMMLAVELPDCGFDLLAGKRTLAVRWGPATTARILPLPAALALALAAAAALRLDGILGAMLLGPAAACALVLVWRALGDPKPAAIAFGGVALYATLVTALTGVYALAALHRDQRPASLLGRVARAHNDGRSRQAKRAALPPLAREPPGCLLRSAVPRSTTSTSRPENARVSTR
ncbi:MAG: UbiA family prenyltransferase [Candidatus Eremiobacteraeota bacterium]|nr:UbiA family prenyltransferase [Candidatus Eremiobacteraeota bacterium]